MSRKTDPYHAIGHKAERPLEGKMQIAGDKSISHRALILGAMAIGDTPIYGLLESEDVLATANALHDLGVDISRPDAQHWLVKGIGIGNFQATTKTLDFGNSGTGCRLMMGALATSPITVQLCGDASLSSRPMQRVLAPLQDMGVQVAPAEADRLPLAITGARPCLPLTYELPVASAQIKSALLLAGLGALGETSVIEPHPSRDHSERMLKLFGARVDSETLDAGQKITIKGEAGLRGIRIDVPGDPSSAAFLIVAALITPHSDVVIENVMINPHRDGLYRVLRQMGGRIDYMNERQAAGETVVDIRVQYSPLTGINVPAAIAPAMIDEYPALAVAAVHAKGSSHFAGLSELRVKESDRLAAIAQGLTACGVAVDEGADDLTITPRKVKGGVTIAAQHDHRIAMSFLILGLIAEAPICIDDYRSIATSFPNFFELMQQLGAPIEKGRAA